MSPCLRLTCLPLSPSPHSPFALASSVAPCSLSTFPTAACAYPPLFPFPPSVLPSVLPFSCILSCRVWGTRLEHRPRHQLVTKTQAAFQHSHRAVLHVNVGPHSQQASMARQVECAGAVLCSAGAVPFSFLPFYSSSLTKRLVRFAWPSLL